MKLRWIRESFLSAKMRDAIVSSNPQCRAMVPPDPPYEPTTGHDALPADAAVTQATGVPTKPRHRRFFGMETRPGTIRL